MLHDDYLCLVESGKQQIEEVRKKFKRKTWKQRQLLSESGFVLRIAPQSLSRDRRIKMKKSNHNKDFKNSIRSFRARRSAQAQVRRVLLCVIRSLSMSLNSVQSFVIENCNGPPIGNGLINNVCLHPLSRTFT